MTREQIDNYFKYHKLSPEQQTNVDILHKAYRDLAFLIKDTTPESPDQTVALRKLLESRMLANLCISCNLNTSLYPNR